MPSPQQDAHKTTLKVGHNSPSHCLFVFDFDKTVVDGNTDGEIINKQEQMGESVLTQDDRNNQGWSFAMSKVFQQIHRDKVTPAEIDEIVNAIPFTPGMRDVLEILDKCKDNTMDGSASTHHTVMLSHSNTHFIDVILKKNDISTFDEIFTFEANWDGDLLQVKPHYEESNGCKICPPDFCKGRFLEEYLLNQSVHDKFDHIVFVGDGGPDYCASTKLRKSMDFTCLRKGYAAHKRIQKQGGVQANTIFWETGYEVAEFIELLLTNPKEAYTRYKSSSSTPLAESSISLGMTV